MSKIILVYSDYTISEDMMDQLASSHPSHKVLDNLHHLSVEKKVEFVKNSNDSTSKIIFSQDSFFITLYKVAIRDKIFHHSDVVVYSIDKEGKISNFYFDNMGNFDPPKNFRALASAYESRALGFSWKYLRKEEKEL